jgi:hypothetical protein
MSKPQLLSEKNKKNYAQAVLNWSHNPFSNINLALFYPSNVTLKNLTNSLEIT